jgi:ABC-type multidrug transport system fused ATPase/permease subunit
MTFFSALCILGIVTSIYKAFNYKFFTHYTKMFDNLPIPEDKDNLKEEEFVAHHTALSHLMSYPSWVVAVNITLLIFSFYLFFWINWVPSVLSLILFLIMFIIKGGNELGGNERYINFSHFISCLGSIIFYAYFLLQYS